MKARLTLVAMVVVGAACSQASPPAPLGFSDIASEVGLDFVHGAFRWDTSTDPAAMMSGGLCWVDYDGDGWLDLFVVNTYAEAEWGRWQEEGGLPTARLYRNTRGAFRDVSEEAGVALALRGVGCVAGDFDLDGHTDLFVTTARSDVLLWNEGDGTFAEGAAGAGTNVYGWHAGAAVGDVNGDGWPDLFVSGFVDPNATHPDGIGFPNRYRARRDLLYLNQGPAPNGHVSFREVGDEVGLEVAGPEYGLGAVFSDLDADGDLDLFVANDNNPNRLYRNDPLDTDPAGIGMRFVDVTDAAGVGDINSGMGVAVADYNDDGTYDLIVTNLGDQLHSVYRNGSALGFAADQDGIGVADLGVGATGWGVSWGDFDNDGDPDLMIANGFVPLRTDNDRQDLAFYENTDHGLVEIGEEVGLGRLIPLHGRGVAVADYDNDGDLDVAVTSISDPLVLLENTLSGPRWLTVDLAGFHPGAVVTAVFEDGGESRCEIRIGSSWLSAEDPRCHFGLGSDGVIEELIIRWPGGRQETVAHPAVNRILVVEEPTP